MILPECRELWDGVESADSLVVNPHKWLGVSFDCSTYFVRDPQFLVRVMSTNPSYLQTAADGQVKNYRDWGIPLGRRMRALKLWFVIRDQGVTHCRRASAAISPTRAGWRPKWRARRTGRFSRRCACRPWWCATSQPGLAAEAIDAHTQAWAQAVNESGEAYLTPTLIDGRWAVRVSFGAAATEQEHVVDLWRLMRENAGE